MMKHHVVFIGDSAVGKTTLIHRIRTGKFDPYVRTTIGCDFSSYEYSDGETKHFAMLWDTCGRVDYISLILPYIAKANLIVIVYDVAKPDSVSVWLEYVPDKTKILIVPVIKEKMSDPIKSSVNVVAKPVNNITGGNVESFEEDMIRLLTQAPKLRQRCGGCIDTSI